MSVELPLLIFMGVATLSTLFLAHKLRLVPKQNYLRPLNSLIYCCWLLKEIILSAIAVSKIAWRRNIQIQPRLEPIQTIQNTEIGVVIYANSITLTPGTVTISTDQNFLLVHALDVKFMADVQEGVMDSKIKNIIKN